MKSARPAILGAATCVAAIVALRLIAYLPGPERLDATALHGFHGLEGGPLVAVAGFGVGLGGFFPLGLALIPLYLLARRWGRRREAVAAILVVLLSDLTAEILKIVLASPRFQPILGPDQINAGSFPSGHAASAMSTAIAWLLVVPRRLRTKVAVGGALFVSAVCFGVLVFAWHFPSDALGGLLVATAYGLLAVAALRRWGGATAADRPRPRERRLALPSVGARTVALAFGLAVGAALLGLAPHALSYAATHTTTVLVALAISTTAAGLLAFTSLLVASGPE